MRLLSSGTIFGIDAISFTNKKEMIIDFTDYHGVLKVGFRELLYFNLSNDLTDMDDDEAVIIEIEHQYRRLAKQDVSYYLFRLENHDFAGDDQMFHIIRIHGAPVIDIICEELVWFER